MSKLVVDETKRMCIEYLVSGMEITKIAEIIGKSRQTIYDWLKQDSFKAALDERIQENKVQAEKIVNSKLPEALNKIWLMICESQSDKVKADLLKYWVDRQLGKPSSQVGLDIDDKRDKDAGVDDDILSDVLGIEGDEEEQEE